MDILKGTKFDFIGFRKIAYLISSILIISGIISLIIKGGPKLGIDFEGGTSVQVKFLAQTPTDEVRDAISEAGIPNCEIQQYGEIENNEFLIRTPKSEEEIEDLTKIITRSLSEKFGQNTFEIRQVEMVGGKVSRDLWGKAMMALVWSWIGILIYVGLRFEWRFAVAAIIALIHDVLVSVGALSLTNRELTLPVIAALLTLVGYSINDTIVIYDRIRENLRTMKKETYENIINNSINQTMSRTILTSFTVFMVVICLFWLGGEVINSFSFILLVGVITGSYSTIFVASPIIFDWNRLSAKRRK